MPLFSDNDTPHRDSDAQTPKPHRRPRSKGPRVSMGSAREELQNEARRIGMLSPDGTHPTPAQQYADHHADEFDILAPLRGSMGVAEHPTRGATGSFSSIGTGSFQSLDPTPSDSTTHTTTNAMGTDTTDSLGGYTIRSYSTDSYSVGSYAAQSAPDSTHSYEGLAGQSTRRPAYEELNYPTSSSLPVTPAKASATPAKTQRLFEPSPGILDDEDEKTSTDYIPRDGSFATPVPNYFDHMTGEIPIHLVGTEDDPRSEAPAKSITDTTSANANHTNSEHDPFATKQFSAVGAHASESSAFEPVSVAAQFDRSRYGQSGRPDASTPMRPVDTQLYPNPADPQAPLRTAGAYSAHRNQQAYNHSNTTDNADAGTTGAHHAVSTTNKNGNNGGGNHNQGKFIPMNVGAPRPKKKKSPARALIIAGVCLVALVVVGVIGWINYDNNHAIDITLNGETVTVSGDERTLEGILDNNLVSVNPGNYVAVDASVMRAGEGNRATITVNDESVTDFTQRLRGGEKVAIADGTDITEPYTDSNEQTIPYTTEAKGVGALHVYTVKGEDGTKVTRTGNESGITVDMTSKEPVTEIIQYYNADTHGDKVAAITIDDGPWDSNTETILNILKDNDAHATFYTIGDQIASHADIVKRAHDEGNEIATHTWDHAAGSGQGVSLNLMATQERLDEVNKGNQAIQDATGAPGSKYFRAPGGNFNVEVAHDLSPLISGEIGWNIDTLDWKRPGTETIASRIKSAKPGEVILMHDGGGDRSQTVAALQEAIPYLKSQGYELITITELIERYPYQG